MSVLNKIATTLGRRDEVPNQGLAKQIAAKKDTAGIKELIENLSNKSKDVQHDCIKVLYEIGELKPALIASYANTFIALLEHTNNRLQWGAMHALDTIASENPKLIYASLNKIITAAEKGSVITRDHAVNILIRLCQVKSYSEDCFSLLNEQLVNAPTNQLAMYAERAMPIINEKNKTVFIQTLQKRMMDLEKESQLKRIQKVIKQVSK